MRCSSLPFPVYYTTAKEVPPVPDGPILIVRRGRVAVDYLSVRRGIMMHMHDLSRREAVEVRAAGGAVGAHVLGVNQFAPIQVGKLLDQADGVEGVASRAKDGAELRRVFPEAFQVVLAMVEDHAAVGVIDAVIEIIAELATTDSLADDLCDGGGG